MDLRIYQAQFFLFQIQSRCNAGSYTTFLDGLQDRSAADRYHKRTGNTLMWSNHEPTAQYWDHAAGLPETTITITTVPDPHGRWVDIGPKAQSADKYHITCKHHKCPGPTGPGDIFVHVRGLAKVRSEVQDAMRVLLAELYASDARGDKCPMAGDGPARIRPMPAEEGPQTYLEPCLEPGIHFHDPPDLATVQCFICAMPRVPA